MVLLLGNILWAWRLGKSIYSPLLFKHQEFRKCFCTSNLPTLFAQPTSKSHSHLLKCTEVTRSLTVEEYQNRRKKLMEMIKKTGEFSSEKDIAHVVVIPSGSVVYMTENIPYPFRQNTDFLYLSGCKEPNCVLIMYIKSSQNYSEHESVLFIPKPNAHKERWEGVKMDLLTITRFLGVDRALYLDSLEKFLQSFAKSNKRFTVWYDYLNSPFRLIHQTMRDFLSSYSNSVSVESPRSIIHEIRLLKSVPEAELMRKSCKIAAESLKEVMKSSRSLSMESHLHAKMDYECRIRGADFLAFPPVVAGGDRANTIHYIENNQIINENEMVLMDAGCEFHGYSSDLARTWPVNGTFTESQRELYEVVLSVQEQLIQMCKKKPSLDHLFKIMCKNLGKNLQELSLIPSSASEDRVAQAAYEFCPHHVSHYLGMDVHDTNLISRGIPLQPGMVVTIEPGVYISRDNTQVPERFRGLCIRIEDDILITNEGFEVLTSSCPKHIKDIEEMLKSR